MDRDEERRIIAQVCAGDTNAFEALVVAYQKQVYNLALRTVGNEEDAADMTQEVFLRAYRALGTFRGESKFSVWLYRLTTNVCIDFLRSRRPSRRRHCAHICAPAPTVGASMTTFCPCRPPCATRPPSRPPT